MRLHVGMVVAALVACGATMACDLDPEPYAPGPERVELNASALLSLLPSVRESPVFVKMNQEPYPTGLGTGADIDVYVSLAGHEAFAQITPEADGSAIDVPPGTMIVREVLAEDGSLASVTLMYKGPPGYNPDLNDFWFGVTDADGVPVVKDGVEQVGRLEACYGCHLDRARDGYLFGVPDAVRGGTAPE